MTLVSEARPRIVVAPVAFCPTSIGVALQVIDVGSDVATTVVEVLVGIRCLPRQEVVRSAVDVNATSNLVCEDRESALLECCFFECVPVTDALLTLTLRKEQGEDLNFL